MEIAAEIEGRNRALVARTEAIPKTEWPAHDSTDTPRLWRGERKMGERN